ncbi:MAG: hypothetical protein GWP08_09765 [Nitrospiraceae bacterium]|nr:hypothetical protein [Nitrospiraceae bacterium]
MMSIVMISVAISSTPFAGSAQDVTGFDAFRAVFVPDAACALDSPRAQRYVARFDRDVKGQAAAFDFDVGLFNAQGKMPPPEIADLAPEARKVYAENGEYQWAYTRGRGSASAIGTFALAWALPTSKHYGDERLRQGVIRGLEAFLDSQLPSGEFAFCSIRYSSVYQTHEMAWRLEPLLAAYLCVRHTLPPKQAQRFHDGLERAADYLYTEVCDSQSNRGCIWCGVMAVAAKVFDRPDYLERVRETWAWVGRRVLHESGMITEGPGPDFIYAYESFAYSFLQRLATGNTALDEPLMRALDWFSTMQDSAGLPMQAASTRLDTYVPDRLAFLVGALEYYARERPYYAALAGEYLDILDRERGAVATDHGSIMWLAAALYHDPVIAVEPLPERLRRFTTSAAFDVTHYLNVRRDYHTLVLFSGVKDTTGLQHWCLAGERPALFEYPGGSSGVRAWGLDTARINLRGNRRTDSTGLDTASVNWGGVRTCYVFGESSTWVINVAPDLRRKVRWAINRKRCATPTLDGHTIHSEGQRSRIDMGPVAPTLDEFEGGWQVRLVLPETAPIDWTVLHDGQAGPVSAELHEGILVAQLREGAATYTLLFNPAGHTAPYNGGELAPLEARVKRLE